jgi:hypothetical protein
MKIDNSRKVILQTFCASSEAVNPAGELGEVDPPPSAHWYEEALGTFDLGFCCRNSCHIGRFSAQSGFGLHYAVIRGLGNLPD